MRGIVVTLPVTPALPAVPTFAPQALRLDAGCWLIRACRLLPSGEVARAPAAANPLFPIALTFRTGIGGAQLLEGEGTPVTARGTVLVRQCDIMLVNVAASFSNLAAEQVAVLAQKLITPPVAYFREETQVVAAAGTGTFNVPVGAVRCYIYGAAAVALAIAFIDAAGAGKVAGTMLGAQALTETGLIIPATAAQVAVGPIAAGATITVVWECFW